MSVYTVRFFAGAVASNGQLLATVPASTVWVLRDLEMLNTGTSPGSVGAYISGSPGFAATVIRVNNVAQNDWHQWEGRVALAAGDELFALVSTGGMQLIATGYSFPLT